MSEKPEIGDLTHIERPPLPWRPERKTECGLDADRHPTWTRDEARKLKDELGMRRFAMHVCMTCDTTADRHQMWEEDPASCIIRHAERMTLRWGRTKRGEEKRRFADELRAIATLIENHREEFDALVAEYGEVVHLKDAQRQVRMMGTGPGHA